MLTSRADEADKIRGFPKVQMTITKPFSLAELEVRVGAILKRRCHCGRKATSDFWEAGGSGAAGGNTQSRANTFNRSRIRPFAFFSQPSR